METGISGVGSGNICLGFGITDKPQDWDKQLFLRIRGLGCAVFVINVWAHNKKIEGWKGLNFWRDDEK